MVKFALIGRPLARFRVTVKVAVPAASFTVTSLIDIVGGLSSSTIVAVPAAETFLVVPLLTVAVSVKFSADSFSVSSVIGVRTSRLVLPAAKVALDAELHVAPPSVETSKPGP